ncbi:MAG: hypothetical protein K8L99_33930 [Anaerolineae bacterium]|nr:hypothetical protein [Anaerolineae bacterium]
MEIHQGFLLAQIVNFIIIAFMLAVPVALVILIVRRQRAAQLKPSEMTEPMEFADQGSQLTGMFDLPSGMYKLRYWLPNDQLAKVDLIAEDGDRTTLLIKRGNGSQAVTIADGGRYALEIEIDDPGVGWKMMLSPLGRKGALA